MAEDGVASNEKFRASFHDVCDGFQVNSTIYFNTEIEFALDAHASECGNFVQGIGNEFLAAEAGIDAHDQDVVDEVEDFRESFDGGGGIEDNAGLAAVGSDEVKSAIEMDAGLLVNGDPVGAGFGKFGDEEIGILDHEVAVKWDFELLAKGFDDRRTDGEIGDKMAIHDVEMENCPAAIDGLLGIGSKLREVGGEN